jgi:hypothetical protein
MQMQRKKVNAKVLGLSVVSLMIALNGLFLFSQATGGTFTGTVTDQHGAVISDTQIKIKELKTGIETLATTNSDGVYTAPFLPSGQYLLTADKAQFKTMIVGPVTLEIAQTVRVDFPLAIGAITETVTVASGEAQMMQAESGEISQTLTDNQIAEMPLEGRSWPELMSLNAGVVNDPSGNGAGAGGYNINGQRSQGNSFMLDGIFTESGEGHNNVQVTPMDGVKEFSIQENSFSAQFGNAAGGVVTVESKGGTNAYHGDAFEYLQNDIVNARNSFSPTVSFLAPLTVTNYRNTLVPEDRFNQFGGSFGGPILTNKMFFFGDFQATRAVTGIPYTLTAPTKQERTGDFSNPITTCPGYNIPHNCDIYDPQSGPVVAPSLAWRNQYEYNGVLNVIPPSQIDPVAKAILAAMPMPNQFDGSGNPLPLFNYKVQRNDFNVSNAGDAQLDYDISTKNRLSWHWSMTTDLDDVPSPWGPGPGGGGCFLDCGRNPNRTWFFSLADTDTIKSNMLNEFRLGVFRWRGGLQAENAGTDIAQQIGMPGINTSPATSGLPFFILLGYNTLGDSIATPDDVRDTTYSLYDTFSWTKGKHDLRFGFQGAYHQVNSFSLQTGRGLYVFLGLTTGSLNGFVLYGLGGGNALASFESGDWLTDERDWRTENVGLRFPETGMFAQDNWKIGRRLTVNLGLRYDILPPYSEVNDHMSNFDLANATILEAGDNGNSRTLRNTHYNSFGPRLGFAWTLGNDEKTVVRGGGGITYANILNSTTAFSTLADNPPHYYQTTLSQSILSPAPYSLSAPFPEPVIPPDSNPSGNVYYVKPSDPPSYTGTWNLAIQRALPADASVELSYMGAEGVHLLCPRDLDFMGPGYSSPGTVGKDPSRKPFYALDPNLVHITELSGTCQSSYNALEAKLQKRYSHGFSILASYTWSKSIDNQSVGIASGNLMQNPLDAQAERGPSVFDRTQRFVGSGVYQLPFGRGRQFGNNFNRMTDAVLGGWQASAIVVGETGEPLNVTMDCGDVGADDSSGTCRPNQIGNAEVFPAGTTKGAGPNRAWFNKAAYAIPSTPEFGDTGRNSLRSAGDQHADIGISKYFKWGDAQERRILIRADMFNAFNHTNLLAPDSAIDDVSFGLISGAAPARIFQLGSRFEF